MNSFLTFREWALISQGTNNRTVNVFNQLFDQYMRLIIRWARYDALENIQNSIQHDRF